MKHITKFILTIVVAFMLVEIFPVNKISADTVYEAELIKNTVSGPESTRYATIKAAFDEANDQEADTNCIVKLLKDCAIEKQLEVDKGAHFTLDLNGYTIDAQKKDRLIYINGTHDKEEKEDVGHLTIIDSSPNHTGALINGYRASGHLGGAGIEVLGQLHFLGGTIRNCRNEGYMDGQGAAIYVEGKSEISLPGYVLMGGNAKIENCYAEAEGGAVYLEISAQFKMDGGTITNCHAEIAGGAVFAFKNSTFEFNGGSINNCNVNPNYDNGGVYDACGGGVFAFSGATVNMKGGEIKNCTAKNGGGIYLKQGFRDIDEKDYSGSQGFLYGGTISNNRATAHGGGVFVQTGNEALLSSAQIARLHLKNGITIDNNKGVEFKDGPTLDNVYLELKMNSGTDGYRPYFYVDGDLTGRVGINADTGYYGPITFPQEIDKSQLDHLFSDDNGKVIKYKNDKVNYLEKGHATILDVHLITWDSDRTSANVEIDRGSHSIKIYAARQKEDLESVFDPETIEIIWTGGRIKDENSNGQVYYDSPLRLRVFGPANREQQRCYYQRVTVFDSREPGLGSYYETWDIRIYFLNTANKVKFTAKDAEVFERHFEYSQPVWRKAQPTKKDNKGYDVYYLPLNGVLKIEPVKKEGLAFTNWTGNIKFDQCLRKTSKQNLTDSTIEFTLIKAYVHVRANYGEKQYTVDVVNGYLNEDVNKTSLATKAGETVNAHFKAPQGVDPNSVRFVKWETSGTFKLDESIVNNENISFVMPKESFTLTAIYEAKKLRVVFYYTYFEGLYRGCVTQPAYESKQIEKIVSPKMEENDVVYEFDHFETREDGSDVPLTTTELDDGNYRCSFVMPDHNVSINIHYKDSTTKYQITYYTKINGVVQDESSKFAPFFQKEPAGRLVKTPFRSKITASDGSTKDLDKFTTDSPDVEVTTTIPVDNTHLCSFAMPAHDVNIYINYYSSEYELDQVNTIASPSSEILESGSTRTITAATAPEGMAFDCYELSSNGMPITDRYTIREIVKNEGPNQLKQDPITIVMPSYNLTVTAKYKKRDYTLRQVNTSEHGNSIHNEGDVVVIKYDDNPNCIFMGYKYYDFNDGIRGNEITNPEDVLNREILDIDGKIIRITMPRKSIEIVAEEYTKPPTRYNLTQIGTQDEGISQRVANNEVNIFAETRGEKFKEYVFYDGLRLVDKNELHFRVRLDDWCEFVMPNYDLTVIALYENSPTIKYTLTQIDTMDAGIKYYADGTKGISVDALNDIRTEFTYEFTHFDFYKENQKLEGAALDTFISKYVSGDLSSGHIKITMPSYNLAVKANYDTDPSIDQYPLTQKKTYNEGTANYKQGTEGIHIKALDIDGYTFQGWKFSSNGVEITTDTGLEQFKNIYVKFTEGTDNKEFDLTMPSWELTVEALFTEEPSEDKYTLVEENTVHTGTYQYRKGTKVDIQALSLIDKEFDQWVFTKLDGTTTVDVASYIIGDLTKDHFTLKMPDFDLKVKATYHDIADKKYTLVQENTIQEGESQHYAGTKISISALEVPGYSFDKWKFYNGTKSNPIEIKDIKKYVVDDLSSDHITLIMPQISELIVEATFKDDPMIVHYLKQINTYDEGTEYHSEGQKIEIRALSFYGSPEFKGWEFYDKDENPITKEEIAPYIGGNLSRNYFYLNMPNFDLIVKATYEGEYPEIYNLEQINTRDTGTESYYAGTQMFINAIENANFTLTGWKFYKDGKELTEETDPTLTEFRNKYVNPSLDPVAKSIILTMPEHDLTVEAIYNETPPETMCNLTQIKTDDEGLKSYHVGTKVSIKALNIQSFNFSGWKFYKDGEEISSSELTTSPSPLSVNNQKFTLTMPDYDLTVEATYTRSPLSTKYKLTTENTTNDGEHMYYSGTKVGIEALTLPGIESTGWKFYYGTDKTNEIKDTEDNKALTEFIENYVLGDVTQDEIVLIMPSQDIYVEATYNETLPDKYELTQIKTVDPGKSMHFEGTKVNIKASEIQGYDFSGWKFYKGEIELSDKTNPTLTNFITSYIDPSGSLSGTSFELTMPGYNLTVEAVYTRKTVEPHKLTTKDASPSSENMFYADTEIEVKADEKAGKIFDHFKVYKQDKELTGADLTNFIATNVIRKGFDSGNFTLKMPNYDLTIQSIYREPIPVTYKSTQVKTIDEGTIDHIKGAHITIQAQKISGYYFKGWKFCKTDGSEISKDVVKAYVIGDITSDRFTLVMPNYDLKVEATFIPIADITPHSLKQINTKDEGVKEYYKGTKVTISAIDNSDLVLKGWRFYKGETELSDTTSPTLTDFIKSCIDPSGSLPGTSFELTMPAYNVTVKAEYELIAHKLTQIKTIDEGEKNYYVGTEVQIKALDIDGYTFQGWKFYKGETELSDATSPTLTDFIKSCIDSSGSLPGTSFELTMPDYDLKVEAAYDRAKPEDHILTQIKTIDEGEKNYYAGTEVQIKALDIDGYTFQGWKFYKGETELSGQTLTNFKASFVNPSSLTTENSFELTMPGYDLKVEAVYNATPPETTYTLTQIKTIDEGEKNYYAGTEVQIKALDIKDYYFTGWKFYKGNKELSDTTSPTLTEFKASFVNPSSLTTENSFELTMPGYDLKVEATYSRLPVAHKLTLIGTHNDGESYLYENEIFSAIRLDVTNPIEFVEWEIYKNDVLLTESTTPTKSEFIESQVIDTPSPKTLKDYNLILMPNYDLTIKAIYKSGGDPVVWHKLEQVYTVDEGSSMHQTNDTITITAITPTSDSGYENNGFKYYKNIDGNYSEIPESSITFDAKSDSSITIKMPDHDLKVVAQFKQKQQKYELTSISTSLNSEGQDVVSFMKNVGDSIVAMPRGTGTFEHWLIYNSDTLEKVEIGDPTSYKLTFAMPAENVTIMPVYDGDFDDIYWIDVVNGYANGEPYDINYKGTDIIVEASEYDGGQFTNWKVYKYKEVEVPVTKSVLLSASPETETDIVTEDISNNMTELAKLGITNKNQLYRRVLYIHQPDFDIELEAKYATGKVQLEVINGTKTYGSPTEEGYDIGSEEKIVANPCPSGMRFSHWRVLEGNPIWYENGQYLDTATLKLVDDVKVEAIYIPNPPYIIPPTGVK